MTGGLALKRSELVRIASKITQARSTLMEIEFLVLFA